MSGTEDLGFINIFHAGNPHLKQPEGFTGDGAENAIEQEPVNLFFQMDRNFIELFAKRYGILKTAGDTKRDIKVKKLR